MVGVSVPTDRKCPKCGGNLQYYPQNKLFECKNCRYFTGKLEDDVVSLGGFVVSANGQICPNCGAKNIMYSAQGNLFECAYCHSTWKAKVVVPKPHLPLSSGILYNTTNRNSAYIHSVTGEFRRVAEHMRDKFRDEVLFFVAPSDNLGQYDLEIRLSYEDIRQWNDAADVLRKLFNELAKQCFVLANRSDKEGYLGFLFRYDKSQAKIDKLDFGSSGGEWLNSPQNVFMKCPQCGEQAISFIDTPCSKCGLPFLPRYMVGNNTGNPDWYECAKGHRAPIEKQRWRCKNGHVLRTDYEPSTRREFSFPPPSTWFGRQKYRLSHLLKKDYHETPCSKCGLPLLPRYKIGNNTDKPDWYECANGHRTSIKDWLFFHSKKKQEFAPKTSVFLEDLKKIIILAFGFSLFYFEMSSFGSGQYAVAWLIPVGGTAIALIAMFVDSRAKQKMNANKEYAKDIKDEISGYGNKIGGKGAGVLKRVPRRREETKAQTAEEGKGSAEKESESGGDGNIGIKNEETDETGRFTKSEIEEMKKKYESED